MIRPNEMSIQRLNKRKNQRRLARNFPIVTSNMKVYASTYDNYLHLTKPFAYLFNKFWSSDQEVVILGYAEPDFELPPNFSFVSLAKKQIDVHHWSTDLRKFFESISDEFFIWTLNDLFLAEPIDFDIFNNLISMLDENVGRIGLMNSVDFDNKKTQTQLPNNVIELKQNAMYRITVAWSIWNREYLLKYLTDGLSGWKFETKGGTSAREDGYRILGTKSPYCISQCNGVRHGNAKTLYKDENTVFKITNTRKILDKSIINDMKQEGVI